MGPTRTAAYLTRTAPDRREVASPGATATAHAERSLLVARNISALGGHPIDSPCRAGRDTSGASWRRGVSTTCRSNRRHPWHPRVLLAVVASGLRRRPLPGRPECGSREATGLRLVSRHLCRHERSVRRDR